MKHTATISDNESVKLCEVQRTVGLDIFEATVLVYGTGGNNFGGGTVTLQASPDGGTTKINLRDVAGTLVSITDDDAYNIRLGNGNTLGDTIELYATMASSTSTPSVTVDVFDNR